MTRALTTYALSVGVAAALAVSGTASMAQDAVGVGPRGYGYGVYAQPYGAYDPGAAYGYYSTANGICGCPPGDLFDYEGPNHGAQVLSR